MNLQAIKSRLKRRFPFFFRIPLMLKRILAKDPVAENPLRVAISQLQKASSGTLVCYLTENFPRRPAGRREHTHGGAVKMTYLAESFPHAFPSANVLYTVSSVGHWVKPQIVAAAKNRQLKVIVNQNGVAYPAWHGAGWENTNADLKQILDQADYILYQSRFCKVAAERFLSPPDVPSEVVYNPVDIRHFVPSPFAKKPKSLTLLLGGNQYERYRFELAVQTFREVLKLAPDARLIVTGSLGLPEQDALTYARKFLENLSLNDKVTLVGAYTQEQAPLIFAQVHILLHTQYNDSSPSLVLEALASGLPVVYIDSGGVPELVREAGIGLPVEPSWERINLPDPREMGAAVLKVMSRYEEFSAVARERAVREFSLESFVSKHRQIFTKMLES